MTTLHICDSAAEICIEQFKAPHRPAIFQTVCISTTDSIEANVENADVNVQNATQQLARAADYQVTHREQRRETRQIQKEG